MNSPIILPNALLSEAQQDCVDKLRETLKYAEDGNVQTVGIIVCKTEGIALVIGGTDAGALNLGCDMLKGDILDNVRDAKKNRATSRIVRARA
jgi:hypothetical protein